MQKLLYNVISPC